MTHRLAISKARIIAFAAAGAAATLLGSGFAFLLRSPVPEWRPDEAVLARAREINEQTRLAVGAPRGKWSIGTRLAAIREMTVEITAEYLDDAPAIAWLIVDPVLTRGYDEILVYVREAQPTSGTVRRIQWTPLGGYSEMTFSSE